MGEVYRTVERAYWRHPKIRPLSFELKMAFRYFFANEHDHISGLYWIPPLYISKEWNRSERETIKVIQQLCKTGLMHYDFDQELAYIPSMLERQIRGKISPNILIAVAGRISEYAAHPFSRMLTEKYSLVDIQGLLKEELRGCEGADGGLNKPYSPAPVPDPALLNNSISSKYTRKGSRIPDDFQLTPELIQIAREAGLNGNIEFVFKKFRSYWEGVSGNKGIKANWTSTWKNWCLNEVEKYSGSGQSKTKDIRNSPNFIK